RLQDETNEAGRDEARSWVVRLASGKLTVEEANALRRWHAADPAHARAFAEAKQQWRLVGTATQELARDLASGAALRPAGTPITRRWLMGAGAAAAAGIGVLAVRPPFGLWSPLVDVSADYRTGIGEVQTIAMGESVTVQLSTRSRLSLESDR